MTFTEQLNEAKHCIDVMKRIGTYHGHKIGVINIEKDTLTLFNGRVCLYREDGDTLITEYACDEQWIEKNLKVNNCLITHSACVCVPRNLVIPWSSKFEKIFGKNV
ncbi:MAG: hypothetical protein PHF86_05385 [Candidatus Nanoarchaeia archaeon]|jgi:hypothetical protein|nr:hypothetical protein [Candidatus Nanoarchaeia archaeon]